MGPDGSGSGGVAAGAAPVDGTTVVVETAAVVVAVEPLVSDPAVGIDVRDVVVDPRELASDRPFESAGRAPSVLDEQAATPTTIDMTVIATNDTLTTVARRTFGFWESGGGIDSDATRRG